ncbi:MAG: hypothetical protein ABIN55_05180 [Aeromicrobium sp.]
MSLRFVLSWVLAPVLVIGAALTGGYWVSARAGDTRSSLTAALDALPDDTLVAGFTNWSSIRKQLDLGDASSTAGRAALNDDASLLDLSTRSLIGRSVEEMHQSFGWSVADLDWEVYGQAADGAAMVARFDDSVSLADVRGSLRKLGYTQDGRVWTLSASSSLTGELATSLASIAIIPGERLVVAADRPTYVLTVLQVIDRDMPSLLTVRSAAQVAGALVGTDSALVQGGALACEDTSLAKQPADVQAQASAAVARAGDLANLTFAGRGLTDVSKGKQEVAFVMGFDSPSVAAAQLTARKALAKGPLIGGSGRIEDSLQLTSSRVDGATATLRFAHDPVSAAYMGGIGPLLFASCPG